jgi:hypothetical protein
MRDYRIGMLANRAYLNKCRKQQFGSRSLIKRREIIEDYLLCKKMVYTVGRPKYTTVGKYALKHPKNQYHTL